MVSILTKDIRIGEHNRLNSGLGGFRQIWLNIEVEVSIRIRDSDKGEHNSGPRVAKTKVYFSKRLSCTDTETDMMSHSFSKRLRCTETETDMMSHSPGLRLLEIRYQMGEIFDYTSAPITTYDEVAEWLRRWTANPMCFARVGSNPILVENDFCFKEIPE
ncbi:hypothetical protein FF38_05612 [Lucilia cuprina]|uniref:Uncharacterized protein n=1 Tax=Lucilia cuprina TaxID=7375 RepID=A0A0L0BUZ5_LUCCU|nr:hypothetical protein FF38_05612 [Lucilia cuprina]